MQSTVEWTKVCILQLYNFFYVKKVEILSRIQIRISEPWMPMRIRQSDACPTGSGSATMRDTAYEMKKLQKSLQSELERTFEGSYFLNE
jgi:hypothetical protein